jgi:glycosyltransferase involved in cell wall biosynthesis
MRVGHNPARFVEKVTQPAVVTVTVVNCIPFLSGYYEQSLDVLKACLNSIHDNTPESHDLTVFDNHSCQEVRQYLEEAFKKGVIQYLILSDKNIGKIGAWNFLFGAAQGEYIVFSDGDILFRPGWLRASLELFETFPNVGMVTARPYRASQKYSEATFEWAYKQGAGVLTEGMFLDWETVWEHSRSIGVVESQAREDYSKGRDYRLTYQCKTAYIGASHFQFMARRDLLHRVIPLPSEQPMRGERALDVAINDLGCMRLTTEKPLVSHMGNRLPESTQAAEPKPKHKTLLQRVLWLPGIRHFLLWLNNRIFRLYFFNVE